jgi:nitrite reductase/ring-hydroxylating ferredoxin subunit
LQSWYDIPDAPSIGTILTRLESIADGGAALVSIGSFRVILLRSGNEVFAYVNRCMHFGVPLAENVAHLGVKPHKSIQCCVHYARYRWRDGYCEFGDCEGDSLMIIPVSVINSNVVIVPDRTEQPRS